MGGSFSSTFWPGSDVQAGDHGDYGDHGYDSDSGDDYASYGPYRRTPSRSGPGTEKSRFSKVFEPMSVVAQDRENGVWTLKVRTRHHLRSLAAINALFPVMRTKAAGLDETLGGGRYVLLVTVPCARDLVIGPDVTVSVHTVDLLRNGLVLPDGMEIDDTDEEAGLRSHEVASRSVPCPELLMRLCMTTAAASH